MCGRRSYHSGSNLFLATETCLRVRQRHSVIGPSTVDPVSLQLIDRTLFLLVHLLQIEDSNVNTQLVDSRKVFFHLPDSYRLTGGSLLQQAVSYLLQ